MSRSVRFCLQLVATVLILAAVGYCDQYTINAPPNGQDPTFVIGEGDVPGGVDGNGALAIWPTSSGFGTASCAWSTAGGAESTTCTGSNWVGSGTGVELYLEPGGNVSDVSTWSDLIITKPGTMTLYSEGNDFVQILINNNWFFQGIQSSQYATYLGAARITTESSNGITTDQSCPGCAGYYYTTVYSNPVPEPSSMLLLFSGLAGLGGLIRRRR